MSDRVPERVAFRSVDDEIALFAATTGAYRGLDATAAAGWTVVAGGDRWAVRIFQGTHHRSPQA